VIRSTPAHANAVAQNQQVNCLRILGRGVYVKLVIVALFYRGIKAALTLRSAAA